MTHLQIKRHLMSFSIIVMMITANTFLLCSSATGESDDLSRSLHGIWKLAEPAYENGKMYLIKATELGQEYGIVFHSDGTLSERANSGWCGTPPITYTDYKGEWSVISDSVLEMEVDFWGGRVKSKREITIIDPNKLGFLILDSVNIFRDVELKIE